MLIDPDHMWFRGLFKPSDMSINYFNQRRRSVCVLMFHASRMSFFISSIYANIYLKYILC